MKAYYLTPSGLKETRAFSPEDTDIPFEMHGLSGDELGYIPSPLPTPCDDGQDVRALLDRTFGPGGGKFVWWTHKGKRYLPRKMATPHLFYALRMVWNHSVPPIWKVGDGPDYSDVPHWNKEYRRIAIQELAKELVSRGDARELDSDLRTQFHEMILKTLTILQLGL